MDKINISWFGRCCFLVEALDKKILFDPYDTFCNVDIGLIESDLLLSSSTWHDHGHIGASPKSWIYTYPGQNENFGFKITGIEALEERGTPTVIFNLRFREFSITNFADFGPSQEQVFEERITPLERQILATTNIAFIRPMVQGHQITDHNIHIENFLKYCSPSILFPEHYFPESFIAENVPEDEKIKFRSSNIIIDELTEVLKDYKLHEIDGFSCDISTSDLNSKLFYKFLHLHPQVSYKK